MANPFRQAVKEIQNKQSYPGESAALMRRITIEGQIVNALVKQALASGYRVSVCDGEEWVVKLSSNRAEIIGACFSTDADSLVIRDPNQAGADGAFKKIGAVQLIYGNDGYDVISDYSSSDLDAFSAWMKPVEDYADTLA